ncbi:MAG: hypothetical protein WD492_13875, partial [Alkalispirochaeta sp.]
MTLSARIYIGIVCLSSIAVTGTFAWPVGVANYPVAIGLLAVASILTQLYELEIYPRGFMSTHATIAITALFVGGLPLALGVVLLSTPIAEVLLRWDNLEASFLRFLTPVVFKN